MENNTEKFDQLFRDKLAKHEVPYNEEHWAELERKIDAGAVQPTSPSAVAKYALLAVSGVVVLSALFYLSDSSQINEIENQGQNTIEVGTTLNNNEVMPENESGNQGTDANKESLNRDKGNEITTSSSAALQNNENLSISTPRNIEDEINKISSKSSEQNKLNTERFMEDRIESPVEDASTKNYNNTTLKMGFSANITKACTGDEIQFTADKSIEGASYYWNFGDGGITSTEQNPRRKFMRSGKFTITLIVSKGEKNDYSNVRENYIEITSGPTFKIDWDNNDLTLSDPYTSFEANSSESDLNYSWKIDNQNYSGKQVNHLFRKKGNYMVELTAVKGSCSTNKSQEITIENVPELFIEEAFTVNNDGLNDLFPAILPSLDVSFDLKILDNSGRLLYQTQNKNAPWNGRINNTGEMVSEGTYKCIIVVKDKYDKEHPYQSLVRVKK